MVRSFHSFQYIQLAKEIEHLLHRILEHYIERYAFICIVFRIIIQVNCELRFWWYISHEAVTKQSDFFVRRREISIESSHFLKYHLGNDATQQN